jgi:hypothetical protein
MLIPSLITIDGVRLTGLAFVGGVAPAGGGYALAYGSTFNQAGRHALANGEAAGAAVVALDSRTEIVAPAKGRSLAIAWRTANADATTVWKLKKDGLVVATVQATGQNGVVRDLPIPTLPGDRYAVEFDAGTSPGRSNFVVLVE